MHLIYPHKIFEYVDQDDKAKAFLRKGNYLYAVFSSLDPQVCLFPFAGRKARLINSFSLDYTWIPDVPTVFLFGNKQNMSMTRGHPLASICRIGFDVANRGKPWEETRPEHELRNILRELAGLAKHKRVLFYGSLKNSWDEDPRQEIRERQIAFLRKAGIEIVSRKVDVSNKKKVLDFMIENKCFASLGMDGDCFSCYRDAELLLSMAPTIRITETTEAIAMANQWGSFWATSEDSENNIAENAEDIRSRCMDGSIIDRLSRGRELSKAANKSPLFFACLESLTMDPELTINLVERSLKEGIPSIISAAVSASGRTSNASWDPESVSATYWNGKRRFSKCRLGKGKKLLKNEFFLGASLEPVKPGPKIGRPELSFVIPCMGKLPYLKKSMDMLLAQGQEVVIVDWSCPDKCGDWAEGFACVKVVRTKWQLQFDPIRSRNAGALEATCEKLCFLDCDMLLEPRFSQTVIKALRRGTFVSFGEGCSRMTACFASDFKKVEGYADDFRGKLLQSGLAESVIGKDLALHLPSKLKVS